jgi:hypothetical protein
LVESFLDRFTRPAEVVFALDVFAELTSEATRGDFDTGDFDRAFC